MKGRDGGGRAAMGWEIHFLVCHFQWDCQDDQDQESSKTIKNIEGKD